MAIKSLADRLTACGLTAARGTNLTRVATDAPLIVGLDIEAGNRAHGLYDRRIEWPLKASMIESIRHHGVQVPVVCWVNGDDPKTGRTQLIVLDGRRRLMHAREVNRTGGGLDGLPVEVEVIRWTPPPGKDPLTEAIKLSVMLNLEREEERISSLAHKAAALRMRKLTEIEIAEEVFRVSIATVRSYLAAAELHPDVLDQLDAGVLPLGTIATFATVPYDEQPAALKAVETSGAASRTEVQDAVGAHRAGRGGTSVPPDRGKLPSRKFLKKLQENLAFFKGKDVTAATALIRAIEGYNNALDDFPSLSAAWDQTKEELDGARGRKAAETKAAKKEKKS